MPSELAELDISNPHSIASMVSPRFRSAISQIPDELLNRKDFEIRRLCYPDEKDFYPPDIDFGLRNNFWIEYDSALKDERPMRMKAIFTDVCSEFNFYEVLKNPLAVAYIITEPSRSKAKSQYALGLVWDKIIALAKRDPEINIKTGLPDSKVWDLQLKLFQFLDQRENGTLVQRIKQETTNLNVEVDGNKAIAQANTEEEVRKILEEVKARLVLTPSAPVPQLEPRLVLPTEISHRDAGKAEVER